jgi:hypothetical protein
MVSILGIDPGFRPEHVVLLDVREEDPSGSFGAVESADMKAGRAVQHRLLRHRPGIRDEPLLSPFESHSEGRSRHRATPKGLSRQATFGGPGRAETHAKIRVPITYLL